MRIYAEGRTAQEADSLAEVEDFNRNDPFAKVGLWKSVSIRPFSKRVDNR